jgi:hypothetical protein
VSDERTIDDLRIKVEIEDDHLVVHLEESLYYRHRNIASGYISLDVIAEALTERIRASLEAGRD